MRKESSEFEKSKLTPNELNDILLSAEEIERLNRFHEKPVPYPIRMLEDYAPAKICRAPDSEDEAFHADLDAITLKQIVSRRFSPRGEKEYLVSKIKIKFI